MQALISVEQMLHLKYTIQILNDDDLHHSIS